MACFSPGRKAPLSTVGEFSALKRLAKGGGICATESARGRQTSNVAGSQLVDGSTWPSFLARRAGK